MKRRGYDIGRVVDLIFEYWLGRMKDSELEEYRHMKETTGLDYSFGGNPLRYPCRKRSEL